MQYKKFVQENFLIDDAKTGQLIPFIFRGVQNKYYDELVRDYDIEKQGLVNPLREIILKARKEGFTSLVLALFAVDDLMNDNPTETLVISYKDDATATFRKRYRNYLLSFGAKQMGYTVEQVQKDPQILERVAKGLLSVDSTEFELKHNKAHFYCGTASARVGGRGGTVQKLLFSEAAFYPDKKEMRAKEVIEGTANQMDKEAGWLFVESTANGDINHYAKMWQLAETKQSRYKARFYGWREFYTDEQFEIIKSEFTDKRMIPQEYPENATEAFLSSGDRFFDPSISQNINVLIPNIIGSWNYYGDYVPGHRYALGADVSEGVSRHNSTIVIIDYGIEVQQKPKVIATYVNNKIAPDLFAYEIMNGGLKYGNCIVCPERNNHGFATLTKLKEIYFNIYQDEQEKLGWMTTLSSKPAMMNDLRTAIHENLIEINDARLKQEIISYPSFDLNSAKVDEEDETQGHYDLVIACFVKGTMVLTDKGQKPIESIKPSDKVMTRQGYKRVLKTSIKVSKVINNIGLTGTANHPIILASEEVKHLTRVSHSDILNIWNSKKQQIEKLSYTKALTIIGILDQKSKTIKDIFWAKLNGENQEFTFIGKFGLITSERYRRACKFITKTTTTIITLLKIFAYYLQASMQNCIWQTPKEKKKQEEYLILKKIGRNKISVIKKLLLQKRKELYNAFYVIRFSIQLLTIPSFAHENVYSDTLERKRKNQKWIESVSFADKYSKQVIIKRDVPQNAINYEEGSTYQQVFNLEVEGANEYFANNILVHNCAIAWQMRSRAMPSYIGGVIPDVGVPEDKDFDKFSIF